MEYIDGQEGSGTLSPLDEKVSPSSVVITKTGVHEPAVGVKASFTLPARPGYRHVCAGITASFATSTNPQTPVHIRLIDGPSGGASLLWSSVGAAPANSGEWWEEVGIAIQGSVNTQMTLEFEAAPVALAFQDLTLHYYDIKDSTL